MNWWRLAPLPEALLSKKFSGGEKLSAQLCYSVLAPEEEALAYVLAARPQAIPNRWIVELADEALGREGKLVKVAQNYVDSLFEFDTP